MSYPKEYWTKQYQNKKTGWDIGYVSTPIKEYIDQLSDKSIKILIPGAGNSHEVEYLHKTGFTNVYLLEFSEEPIANFIKRAPSFPEKHIVQEDFFTHQETYDLIIEQTFFSSLQPKDRVKYVNKTHELLSSKGLLVGLLFNIDFKNVFPPFGGSLEIYTQLFSSKYKIEILETAYNSIKPRKGNELFFKMIKK